MHAHRFAPQIAVCPSSTFAFRFGFKIKWSLNHSWQKLGRVIGKSLKRQIFCLVSVNKFIIKISEKNTETYLDDPVLNICTLVCQWSQSVSWCSNLAIWRLHCIFLSNLWALWTINVSLLSVWLCVRPSVRPSRSSCCLPVTPGSVLWLSTRGRHKHFGTIAFYLYSAFYRKSCV